MIDENRKGWSIWKLMNECGVRGPTRHKVGSWKNIRLNETVLAKLLTASGAFPFLCKDALIVNV